MIMLFFKFLGMLYPFLKEVILGNKKGKVNPNKVIVFMCFIIFLMFIISLQNIDINNKLHLKNVELVARNEKIEDNLNAVNVSFDKLNDSLLACSSNLSTCTNESKNECPDYKCPDCKSIQDKLIICQEHDKVDDHQLKETLEKLNNLK